MNESCRVLELLVLCLVQVNSREYRSRWSSGESFSTVMHRSRVRRTVRYVLFLFFFSAFNTFWLDRLSIIFSSFVFFVTNSSVFVNNNNFKFVVI